MHFMGGCSWGGLKQVEKLLAKNWNAVSVGESWGAPSFQLRDISVFLSYSISCPSWGELRWFTPLGWTLYWLTGFAYGHPHIYGLGDHTDQKEILVYQNSDKLIGVENVPCRWFCLLKLHFLVLNTWKYFGRRNGLASKVLREADVINRRWCSQFSYHVTRVFL